MVRIILLISISLYVQSTFAFKVITPDVHESMARASKACLDSAVPKGSMPKLCPLDIDNNNEVDISWMHDSSLEIYDIPGWVKRGLNYTARYPDLEEAVRWPDDPTKELSAGIFKWGSKLLLDTCESYRNISTKHIDLNAGLICVSHFGDLQFLHAQASEVGEPAEETYEKIISWASFLYLVASAKLSNEDLDRPYCSYFNGNSSFDRAMLPDKESVACTSKNGKWRLATLFNITCSSPKPSSLGCNEWTGSASYDKARIMATGALLHLIQDSYSQSHVKRGICETKDEKVVAKIECSPVGYFTTYQGQVNHGDADQKPYFAKESCSEQKLIDDPVLAGSKALWYIQEKEKQSLDNFKQDVLYRVFGTPQYIKAYGKPAELGDCFVESH